jgi:hypothetical protein
MKTDVPEVIKSELPHTKWGKILGTTPVVLTVVATLLAGLASSEMTTAQYDRAYAAQLQSKAGDQWSYFQAKKLRSAIQHNTLDLLTSLSVARSFDAAAVESALAGASSTSPVDRSTLELLAIGELPAAAPVAKPDPTVTTALEALRASRPEAELTVALADVKDAVLEKALRAAQADAQAFDATNKPVLQRVDALEQLLANTPWQRDYFSARLRLQAQRYDAEAALNQSIGSLYELQVRKSNISAERHHRRSQRFFFGMLAAQAGVILSTLAMAAQRRSLLWGVAAAAGSIAIAFAVYVYWFV